MDAQLLIWIVEHYTEAGETILDPMAGSGTSMLACTLGRDVVLVELEQKFIRLSLNNWQVVKQKPQLGSIMGECFNLWGDARDILRAREHPYEDLWLKYPKLDYPTVKSIRRQGNIPLGDARQLEGLVDKIVTSPPFVDTEASMNPHKDKGKYDTVRRPRYPNYMDIDTRQRDKLGRWIPSSNSDETNIGNLPYGEIDKCIFSPPYAEAIGRDAKYYEKIDTANKKRALEMYGKQLPSYTANLKYSYVKDNAGDNPDNVGNLPYGQIDKIVTSPPYEEAMSGGGIAKYGHFSDPELAKRAYSAENMNIKKQIERVKQGKAKMKRPDVFTSEGNKAAKGFFEGNYSRDPQNIGNLKSESYLEAMLQVYQSCFAVLKSGGLMVLVTKNFIRNKQVVRLDTDTIKLCEQAGFSFVERHYRELPSQSFWRVIYHQKFPDVEQIKSEDVLVFSRK